MPSANDGARFEHGEWITCAQLSPGDGSPTIMSSSWDKTIKFLGSPGEPPDASFELHKDKVNTFVCWSAKSMNLMITGSDDGTVKIFKPTGAPIDKKYSVELGNIKVLADIDIGCRVFTASRPRRPRGESR